MLWIAKIVYGNGNHGEKPQPHEPRTVRDGAVLRGGGGIFMGIVLRGYQIVNEGNQRYPREEGQDSIQQPRPLSEGGAEAEKFRHGDEEHHSCRETEGK